MTDDKDYAVVYKPRAQDDMTADYPQPKPPRITRTRWQLVRWHLRCAWRHFLGRRI